MKLRQLNFSRATLKIFAILALVVFLYPVSLIAAEYKDDQMFHKLFAFHSKLASQGNLESITQLGLMYERGEGVEKSRKKAIELYQLAADKGYQPAIEYLVNINANQANVTDPVTSANKLRVPTPKNDGADNKAVEKQKQLEDELEKQQQAAESARAELERLRQAKLEQERKQQKLQEEIEQSRKAQEQIARERDKAEAARREMELTKKKQEADAVKQQEAVAKNQDPKQPAPKDAKPNDSDKSKFSSNPCNTPAAKFMSTCN